MTNVRLGLVGSGFIARNFSREVGRRGRFEVSKVLTRRRGPIDGFDTDRLTNSIDQLIEHADVLIECSGDPVWATEVIEDAVDARIPVVTMNTEFHITSGSTFVGQGLVTEAAGDQPGCLAELHEEAVELGFSPIVYGNMKGFLNEEPTPEEMKVWANKQGISLPMVTSFTDGTKVQAEQILVGNHFGATIIKENLLGPQSSLLEEAAEVLAAEANRIGRPISDYVLSRELPHGVFIVATHDDQQRDALRYYKLGEGPNYILIRNNIFVHLEILKTVRRILDGGRVLLDNSREPELSLAAVAKRDLLPGDRIEQGIGSFAVRGKAVRIADHPSHMPIGLLQHAVVEEAVSNGEILTWSSVSIPDTSASRRWLSMVPA